MDKENKETIIEIITGIMVIVGLYTNNKYVLFFSMLPICISVAFWYNRNVSDPIKSLEEGTKELHKDLNTRKEIENIKIQVMVLKMKLKESKKAGLDPFWFISILAIIAMIVLYLKDKGFI